MAVTTSQITITTMEGWYSGDTAPSNPLIGDLWLDTTSNEIKKWDGTNWVKQADTQGPQGPKGDSIKSREAYWIKSSSSIAPEPPDPKTGNMKGWTEGSEPPESALAGILPSDKFWRIYKETYSNGENEYSKYSEVELIGSYEVLNGLVQFRKGVATTENIGGQDVTVIDGGKIKTGSIDAKKIYVEDLEALKATIGGFHIGKNSIYSGNKKTIDSTERGIYFDSNGQSYFGDNKNFIRFFRSDKDNYKLQISADSLTFGSGVSVEKAFEDIKGDIQNAQGTADAAKEFTDNAKNNFGYQYKAEIEVAGDANTYYPVMIFGGDQDVMREILIKRSFRDKAPEAWGGHPNTHGIGCTCKIKCNFGEWGGAEYDWRIHELNEVYGHVFAGCEIHRDRMFFFIFLRGGGATYTLYSDQEMNRIPEYYHTTVTEAPSIWYNGGLIGWSGGTAESPNYTFYAPQPRTYTDDVIKEIHDKTYIQVATDAYKNADKAQGAADNAQSSADKAQNTANKAQTAINNLEIGGRNLVTNSINLSDFKIESSNYTTRVISEDCCIVNRLVNHINSGSKYGIYKDIRVTAGEEYTVSCTVKEITGSMQLGLGDANMWVGLGSWNLSVGRFTCTVTAPSSATFIRIYIFGNDGVNGGSATVSNIKLEKGNRATDWTPAPEDVDAGITNAQTTADTAKTNAATAQSTADTAKANAAAAQTAADNAQSTANTAQSKADKAQGAANKAQSSANTAQNTANKAQTAADEALKGTKENAAQMAQMVTDFNGDIKNLQDQIDGNITTWFYNVDPAMNLPPVTDWDTDKKKDAHLGDIYYNTVKGYAWRFMKSGSTYSWERITDTDVTKALADAAKAQDTANSKRRVFYSTPTVPYDAGDLWVQGSDGDILRCAQAKTSAGSYNRNDWVLASKYTDNSALNTWIEGEFATKIQELEEGLVDAKIETYYQTTDPSTGWSSTQKSEHKGDLWYNSTTSVQKYYRWSGTTWEELTATPPQAVFDSIDNKATIYTGEKDPSSPSQGDLWLKGTNDPILTYVGNTWVKYDKYTDDTKAEKAITNAATAQSTATEAAKTADNYISADSIGIMVSENNGATKETPSNATKNNVLITDQDVQIRNGQKTVASYGETSTIGSTAGKNMRVSGNGVEIRDGDKVLASYGASEIVLGDLSGDNILLDANRMVIRAGAADKMIIESVTITKTVTERHEFDGAWLANILSEGKNAGWGITLKDVIRIGKVSIQTDSGKEVEPAAYRLSISGSYLEIWLDQSNPEAMAVDWTEYTTLEVTYESGNIVSNAKCDKFEAKDNAGKFVSFTEISSGTGTAKATTGRVTTQPNWWRCGNLVQLEFGVAATAAVKPGNNIATGTITGIPRPVTTIGLRAVSYYGNNANVTLLSKDGAFTVRNCGSDALAKGNDASGIFTYITDGTFTGGGA